MYLKKKLNNNQQTKHLEEHKIYIYRESNNSPKDLNYIVNTYCHIINGL